MNNKQFYLYCAEYVSKNPIPPQPNTTVVNNVHVVGYIIVIGEEDVSDKSKADAKIRLAQLMPHPKNWRWVGTSFNRIEDRDLEAICAEVLGIDVRAEVEEDSVS